MRCFSQKRRWYFGAVSLLVSALLLWGPYVPVLAAESTGPPPSVASSAQDETATNSEPAPSTEGEVPAPPGTEASSSQTAMPSSAPQGPALESATSMAEGEAASSVPPPSSTTSKAAVEREPSPSHTPATEVAPGTTEPEDDASARQEKDAEPDAATRQPGNLITPQSGVHYLLPSVEGAFTPADLLIPSGGEQGPASYATTVDGDYNTAGVAGGSWQWMLEVDMGEIKPEVNKLRLSFGWRDKPDAAGTPQEYQVLGSANGDDWLPLYAGKPGQTGHTQQEIIFSPLNLRYIRVRDGLPDNRDSHGSQYQMAVGELEAYATGEANQAALCIVATAPKNNQTDLYPETDLKLFFNQRVDLEAVIPYIELRTDWGVLPFDATADTGETGGAIVTLHPRTPLAPGQRYALQLGALESAVGECIWFYTAAQGSGKPNLALGQPAIFVKPDHTGPANDLVHPAEGSTQLPPSGNSLAAHAVDGDKGTEACAGGSYWYQLQVDLGKVHQNVNEVELYFGLQNLARDTTPMEYELLLSEDGASFERVKSINYGSYTGKYKTDLHFFAPQPVRYLRIRSLIDMERNEQGALMQMTLGEVAVRQTSDSEPFFVSANIQQGLGEFPLGQPLVLVGNKPFPESTRFSLQEEDGGEVPFVLTRDDALCQATLAPQRLLRPATNYRLTAQDAQSGLACDVGFSTLSQVGELSITTTSGDGYEQDPINALYPAFVDGIEYQAWTPEGATRFFAMQAVGGAGEYRWELAEGRLPQGLTLGENGHISGLPTKEETTTFTARVTDGMGGTAEKQLQMEARPYRSQWHEEARFGVMVQWGSFSAPAITTKEQIPEFERRAEGFDADAWAQAVADMGGEILNFTVVGGDSVRLWPSTSPSYSENKTQRDYVGELIEACHARDIKFVAYMPAGFQWQEQTMNDGDLNDRSWNTLHKNLISELIDKGIDGLWIDSCGSIGSSEYYFDWDVIVPIIRTRAPGLLIGSNPVGLEWGYAMQYPYSDFVIYEGHYKKNPADMTVARHAPTRKRMSVEYDAMMQNAWSGGAPGVEQSMQKAEDVIPNIQANWAQGVVYMAAVATPPDGRALCDPTAAAEMAKIGAWVRQNKGNASLWNTAPHFNETDVASLPKGSQTHEAFFAAPQQQPVASTIQGTPDNWDSFMGMEFTTGETPVILTHLGRYVLEGNCGLHRLRLTKQGAPEQVLRQAELDLSAASPEASGFAYAPVNPILLEPGTVYYITSSEDCDDSVAKPNLAALQGNSNLLASTGAWLDYSGTRTHTPQLPGSSALYFPYMRQSANGPGGGLVNAKVVAGKTRPSSNLVSSSVARMTDTQGAPSGASGWTQFPQHAIDGNAATFAVAGDDNWQWALTLDMGYKMEGISLIECDFAGGNALKGYKIFASDDGEDFALVQEGENATAGIASLAIELSEPLAARYLRIQTLDPAPGSPQVEHGKLVCFSEVRVYNHNLALSGNADFVAYGGGGHKAPADDFYCAGNAIDKSPLTTARADKKGTALKVTLDGRYELKKLQAVSENKLLEILISTDGKKWNQLSSGQLVYEGEGSYTFGPGIRAKYLLLRSAKASEVLEISAVSLTGDRA